MGQVTLPTDFVLNSVFHDTPRNKFKRLKLEGQLIAVQLQSS